MKLIYRISLRLSLVLLPLIALWAVVFYFTMVDEINDEVDDALEDYSELIVIRMLSGELLPRMNEGSNNSYTIAPVDENYAAAHPGIDYYDAEVYIPEKEETEPARFLVTIFQDGNGQFYELKVATPTFEKDELLETILWWVVWLYLLLLITVVGTTMWIFYNSMRPLYALLHWLDGYVPGHKTVPVPNNTSITGSMRLLSRPWIVPRSCWSSRSSLSATPRTSCRRRLPCWADVWSICSTTRDWTNRRWEK